MKINIALVSIAFALVSSSAVLTAHPKMPLMIQSLDFDGFLGPRISTDNVCKLKQDVRGRDVDDAISQCNPCHQYHQQRSPLVFMKRWSHFGTCKPLHSHTIQYPRAVDIPHLYIRPRTSDKISLAIVIPKVDEATKLRTKQYSVDVSTVRKDGMDGDVINDCYHMTVWDYTRATKPYKWTPITTDQKCGADLIEVPEIVWK